MLTVRIANFLCFFNDFIIFNISFRDLCLVYAVYNKQRYYILFSGLTCLTLTLCQQSGQIIVSYFVARTWLYGPDACRLSGCITACR